MSVGNKSNHLKLSYENYYLLITRDRVE